MIIAVDWDGTCVEQDRPYDDVKTPPKLRPGAKAALAALKRAGHVLVLWSARASPALRTNPSLDPLVRAGVRKVHLGEWQRSRAVNEARYQQMLGFVRRELPGVFDAIDDGAAGKLPGVDLFVDDRAVRFGYAVGAAGWPEIAEMYGAAAPRTTGAPARAR